MHIAFNSAKAIIIIIGRASLVAQMVQGLSTVQEA